MGVEPVEAGRRIEYPDVGGDLLLLAVNEYVQVGVQVIIVELVSVALHSAYCRRLGGLVKESPGSSHRRYPGYDRNDYHH
jgi:hypothetical protein